MKFEIEKDQLDLGETPVENMFINTLMANADEAQIKVYLYALSLAYRGAEEITNEIIAKDMNLTEGQVVDAWSYWIDKNIVEKTSTGYKFKSMRAQRFALTDNFLDNSVENNAHIEIDNIMGTDTIEMINSIESFISQGSEVEIKLDPREIRKVLELINDFNVSPFFVSYAYMMAANERGKKSVDPIVATIRNWIIDGATDMEKLDKYLSEKEKNITTTNKAKTKQNKTEKLIDKDNRMSKAERLAFVEKQLQQRLPIKKIRDRKE